LKVRKQRRCADLRESLAERRAVWFIATHGSVVRSEISALLTSQNYTLDWVTHSEVCARSV